MKQTSFKKGKEDEVNGGQLHKQLAQAIGDMLIDVQITSEEVIINVDDAADDSDYEVVKTVIENYSPPSPQNAVSLEERVRALELLVADIQKKVK
jgi:hypothetical protein